ncbi:adenylate/guanylate cyclase domain-containing protein [Gemmatimonas sp.]|uniref:adenylate/guanylate cyclase domain-containing protein n=1 Tax=Gemmatimonas sp. TaxID=1962908 RepID=UPI00286B8182|nr:adenylate/guanylate cyclase domain-containing protein [Gemmatimonas sp.]
MPLVLVSASGDRRFPLTGRSGFIAGRELSCTLPILDPAVSRRHAELRVSDSGTLEVEDLKSRNGTWVNGARVQRATVLPGDTLAFGTVAFTLLHEDPVGTRSPSPSASASASPTASPSESPVPAFDGGSTVLFERRVPSREQSLADVAHVTAGHGQAAARLAQLVGIAQHLGGSTDLDALLEALAGDLFRSFDADRVAILLRDSDGLLQTRVSRDRRGNIPRPVPRAIANGVAERQVALLTNDAGSDARTAGASVLQQSVQSAMAAPLIGEQTTTLGVLYVDHLRDTDVFTDEDLAFLVAFAGIASAAVEREAATARLQQAARVRANFERYFAPQIARRIADSTGRVAPGGARQHVVVLFSDIRGFTSIAESLPPTQMADQLNEYFGAMVDCVFRHEGALDKFIGDAIMAYWGVPEAGEHDAGRAVAAALDMQLALSALNARWAADGRPLLSVGIGIHSGDAFVGNIGSPRRLEFTLIGDTVNVANRLCSLAAGGEILVSDAVRDALADPNCCTSRSELAVARQHGAPPDVWQVLSGWSAS